MPTTARRLVVSGFALFLVVLVVGLLTWGSMGQDNDLWTHLSAGRHIVANGEVPSESFSSCERLRPPEAAARLTRNAETDLLQS